MFHSAFKTTETFEYSAEGQRNWVNNYPKCGGNWQSPIIISGSRAIPMPLPSLEMIGYRNLLYQNIQIKNNGNTVVVIIKNELIENRNPYIFGAMLPKNEEYELDSFHFHWGLKNSKGSEHILHGIRYPMEMHLVHRNTKYENIQTALENEDGLSVLGIFFEVQEEDNESLKPLLNHLSEIQFPNSKTQINSSITLASLLPAQMDTFYTYKGSLTTPPCSEAVTWMIFTSKVPISYKQMSKFRLMTNERGILADNYRNVQDLGPRKIYVRKIQPLPLNKNRVVEVDVSTLNWNW